MWDVETERSRALEIEQFKVLSWFYGWELVIFNRTAFEEGIKSVFPYNFWFAATLHKRQQQNSVISQ